MLGCSRRDCKACVYVRAYAYMCLCVCMCVHTCVCVYEIEVAAPPSLGCYKTEKTAMLSLFLVKENSNRITIWNFLKHFRKDLNCLSIVFACRYVFEYTPAWKRATSQEQEGLAFQEFYNSAI